MEADMSADNFSGTTPSLGAAGDADTSETMGAPRPLTSDQALLRTSELLRKAARAAPLSSLSIAFLLGVVISRRR